MGKTIKVFVYGTLRNGCRNRHIVERYIVDSEKITINGTLYNVGEYPALVIDESGNKVTGELLTVKEEALRPLDTLEGYIGPNDSRNYYERVLHPNGFYVYIWEKEKVELQNLKQIVSGDWLVYSSLLGNVWEGTK